MTSQPFWAIPDADFEDKPGIRLANALQKTISEHSRLDREKRDGAKAYQRVRNVVLNAEHIRIETIQPQLDIIKSVFPFADDQRKMDWLKSLIDSCADEVVSIYGKKDQEWETRTLLKLFRLVFIEAIETAIIDADFLTKFMQNAKTNT